MAATGNNATAIAEQSITFLNLSVTMFLSYGERHDILRRSWKGA
ncbi:hypothetical protein [Terriglobus roseus]|nr:hypothetical protein [Terriglobus roseus]